MTTASRRSQHAVQRLAGIAAMLAGLWLLLSVAVYAQATAVPDLNRLTPEQRRAVLEALGQQQGTATIQPSLEMPQTVLPPAPSAQPTVLELPAEPTLSAGSTLILTLTVDDAAKREAINAQPRFARLLGSRTYELDRYGQLQLPEVATIPLAGLTAEQAAARIAAEPDLHSMTVSVKLLPLRPTGPQALHPFGYSLFQGVPTTFAPATDIPVPADYVIGPDDTVLVQLFGKQNAQYSLVVTRDGTLNFPEIGPISVAGMRFEQMKADLEKRIEEQMIGTRASIALGQLRSIRVFVLGDVEQPGSYTISGLSTITNALFVSGGMKSIGSLRRIQLKRDGRVVQQLDLYDLLLRGDTSRDVRVLPGDVIFVPSIGPSVGVEGEVRRPAVYELAGETTAAEVIALAGGLLPTAAPSATKIERIDEEQQQRTLIAAHAADGSPVALRAGDIVRAYSVFETFDRAVELNGNVYREGLFQWRPGMRLSDLIPSVTWLKPDSDLQYVLIRRERLPDRQIDVLSADLAAAWQAAGSPADVELQSRDRVTVFDQKTGRAGTVQTLLDELRRQSSPDQPSREVGVSGRVRQPGRYPLERGMRVGDVVRAGGGLTDAAYLHQAELTRYHVQDGELRQTELLQIDLVAAVAGDPAANVLLRPYDHLVVKIVPSWYEQEEIELLGEVRFPGNYPIQRGETLRSVIERAGGLTEDAFPRGAIFLREDLKAREREQIETLTQRLERDLATLSLQAVTEESDAREAFSLGQSLLQQLRGTEPVGRLVIDLPAILAGSSDDVLLKARDRLLVPRLTQEVTVLGEVQHATSHLHDPGLQREDYIRRSGGFTVNADAKRIYVVRANGAVLAQPQSVWYSRSGDEDIETGDTIVVPLDADRVRPLTLWTSVTQIIYNLAIAVAAVNSF